MITALTAFASPLDLSWPSVQVDITLGILIASLTFFRFENGWRASLNGGAASSSANSAVKATYDPRTEKKNAPWVV